MADQEVTLRDELASAFDGGSDEQGGEAAGGGADGNPPDVGAGVDGGEKASAPEAKPADDGKPAADGRARDEHGRFVKQEKSESVPAAAQQGQAPDPKQVAQAAAPESQAAQEQQQGVDLPPSTWSAAAKAEYAKLPPLIRGEIKKREADFQKGIQQYKQAAEQGTKVLAEFQPYAGLMQRLGATPEGTARNFLRTAAILNTGTPQEKGKLLMDAAQAYGADLSPWMGKAPAGDGAQPNNLDPQALTPVVQQLLQPLQQKISQFESRFSSAEQQREAAQQQEAQGQIEAFRTAVDEKGNPKHVYFDNVRSLMGSILEDYAARGLSLSMEKAYEMACNADPEVRQQLDAERRQRDEAARLAEQRRVAEDARRAQAVNVQGQGAVGIADPSKIGLRDELAARLDGRIA